MYNIEFSNNTKQSIAIDQNKIDNTTSLTLYGQLKMSYGMGFEGNLVKILENFACPEDFQNPGNPDLSKATDGVLNRVIEGQFWYNKTNNYLYYFDGTSWISLGKSGDYAANWGVISHGELLPQPVSEYSGVAFDYSDCVWIVSPYEIPQSVDYLECFTDDNAVVSMRYRYKGTSDVEAGFANYLIVGIKGNVNNVIPAPVQSSTPTPTPSSTTNISPTPTPTPTPTNTPTNTPAISPSLTPSITPTPQSTVTPTPTRTPPIIPPSPTPSTTQFSALSYTIIDADPRSNTYMKDYGQMGTVFMAVTAGSGSNVYGGFPVAVDPASTNLISCSYGYSPTSRPPQIEGDSYPSMMLVKPVGGSGNYTVSIGNMRIACARLLGVNYQPPAIAIAQADSSNKTTVGTYSGNCIMLYNNSGNWSAGTTKNLIYNTYYNGFGPFYGLVGCTAVKSFQYLIYFDLTIKDNITGHSILVPGQQFVDKAADTSLGGYAPCNCATCDHR